MNAQEQDTQPEILFNDFSSFQQAPFKLISYPKPQTPFAILNQTLVDLKNDTIKKYNTEINHIQTQNIFRHSHDDQKSSNNHCRQCYSTFDEVLVPEPWYNVDSIFPTESEEPLTEIRQRPSKLSHLSKSFHLPKNLNCAFKKRSQCSKQSSISSHEERENKSLYGKSEKWKDKVNKTLNQQNEHFSETLAQFNSTNEQKTRVTLENFVHQKKHQKMSRILKLKTHSLDIALENQQKLTNQSKNLIEALQKFSNDNMLRKSIDRAVDVLKKRTHNLTYNKSNSKQNFVKTEIDKTSTKCLSCHKISINEGGSKDGEKTSKHNKVSTKCVINEEVDVGKIKMMQFKQKGKIAFRPKRSYLIESGKNNGKDKNYRPLGFEPKSEVKSLIEDRCTSKKSSKKPNINIYKQKF